MSDKVKYLRRYTELPFLIHLLHSKQLTLLNPRTWDDKNDIYFMDTYRKKNGFQSLLALCFSECSETYHHWKVFSGNSSGVCIEFEKIKLLDQLSKFNGLRYGSVEYRTIKSIEEKRPRLEELPFIKRRPFKDEKEFRIIYEEKDTLLDYKNFDIELSVIHKVIINPWMPEAVFNTVKPLIKSILGCSRLKISKTTLVNNEAWKKISPDIV